MGFFDDILLKEAIADEADRLSLSGLADKYPALRTKIDETDTLLKGWETWKDGNWDETAGMPKLAVTYKAEAEAAQARITQMESVGGFGAEMTFEEISSKLATEGYIKKGDLATAITEPVRTMVNSSASGIEFFFRKTSTLPIEHYKEFGEVDPKLMDNLLDAYSKAPTGTDPRKVYDEMVASRRETARVTAEAARTTQFEADKAEAVRLAVEKDRLERGMGSGTPGVPTDQGGGPSAGMGPIQRSQMEKVAAAENGGNQQSANALGSITQREGAAWLRDQRTQGVQ